MNPCIAKSLLASLALMLGVAATAAGNDKADIYLKNSAEGSVELSNLPADDQYQALSIEAPAGAAAEPARATPAVASQATADKSAAQAPVAADNTIAWFGSIPASEVKEPGLAETLSKIKPALLNSGNPATGRRYLMMDRNTYLSQNPAN